MELKISLHGQEESKAKSIKKQKTTWVFPHLPGEGC